MKKPIQLSREEWRLIGFHLGYVSHDRRYSVKARQDASALRDKIGLFGKIAFERGVEPGGKTK